MGTRRPTCVRHEPAVISSDDDREAVTVLPFPSVAVLSAFKLWTVKRQPRCKPPEVV
jgi:hypothetical protein